MMATQPRVAVPPHGADGVVAMGALLAMHTPGLQQARSAFLSELAAGQLDPAVKELVRLRNAQHTDCEY